jgi:thymidylate synthase (FAD)
MAIGPKDRDLIRRIIAQGHTSTLEHMVFVFDIEQLSRAALQELARHRHASLSVRSTRYTLSSQLKDEEPFL